MAAVEKAVVMRMPQTVRSAEMLGRVRLSRSFFMRDFLYSEITAIHGISNMPDDPDLAIAAGRLLCEELLEPLQTVFGRVAIRSAYRSVVLNAYGNAHGYNCARNERNYARHIWDRRDAPGCMGALACVALPWLADRVEAGRRGRRWRGGSTTTCPTASCSSSRSWGHSTLGGINGRSARSTATPSRGRI